MMRYGFLVLLNSLFLSVNSLAEDSLSAFDCKPQSSKLGIILNTSHQQDKSLGCQIKQIIPLSIAWYSKLRANDWISSINNLNLKQKDKPCQLFKDSLVQSNTDLFKLIVYSDAEKLSQKIIVDRAQQNQVKQSKLNIAIFDNKLNKNCLSSTSSIDILPQIQAIQSKPDQLESVINDLQIKIEQSKISLRSIRNIIQTTNYSDNERLKIKQTNHDLIKNLKIFLSTSHQLSDDAFKKLSIEEKQFFMQNYKQLSDTIETSHQLINESNREKIEIIVRLFEIAFKVDYIKLQLAAKNWFQLEQYDWSEITFPKKKKEYSTEFGSIMIGTYADDIYYLNNKQIVLIIDPGGNDQYLKKDLGNHHHQHIIYNTAIIDLSGDDKYLSTANRGLASAILGVSLLIDKKGDDSYSAKTWAQSSAFAGISVLYDLSGDDHYQAESFSQASALFGEALLADIKGNDNYIIKHHGQGLGLSFAYGLLFDREGNDTYTSQNGLISSYPNTPKSTESWSQGCGKGFRYILPGGVGLLVDMQGKDKFIADEFTQGNGYYFAMGLLFNIGTDDDQYQATRYSLGSSAHQAISGFIEQGGDDKYQTSGPAFCGSGWDQSISYFNDQQGDDCYSGYDFSLGAQLKSIATFKDKSGNDKQYTNSSKSTEAKQLNLCF